MRKFINDICNELGAEVERAMCDWSDSAAIEYRVKSGRVLVSIDHNDDMSVTVIHNNGVVREHENIKNAIYRNMCGWDEVREAFIN